MTLFSSYREENKPNGVEWTVAETNTTENSKFVVVMVQLVQTDGVFFNPNKQSLHWISIHFNILVKSTFPVTIMLLSLELKSD